MRDSRNILKEFNSKYPLKRIKVNNKDWDYVVKGSGKDTVVIFPGGGQDAQSPFKLIDSLEPFYKVISISIYNVDSIDEFCHAVDNILEKEKSNPLIVYGLSLGALLAQSYVKRNLDRVRFLIISHGTSPKSITYKKKIILPLRLLNLFLPIIPQFLITFIAKSFSGKVQGNPKNAVESFVSKEENSNLLNALAQRYYNYYLTKRLLMTWINLHFDFYNDSFTSSDFDKWKGKVLIIRTDNDPLMQDDGEFKKIYPNAMVYTLTGTGHLSFHYKGDEIIKVIKLFLQSKDIKNY